MDKIPCNKELKKNQGLEKLLQSTKENEVKLLQRVNELERIEKCYNALMQNTEDYILICDKNGVSQAFNASYKQRGEELLKTELKPGIKPHQLSGKSEIVEYWDSLQDRALKGEKLIEEYYDKDRNRYYETVFCPVKEGKEISGFTEITREITQRKRMEKELRDSHSFNSSLLEQSPNAIVVYNPDTSIRYVNPFFERLSGYSAEEAIGLKIPYPWSVDDAKIGDVQNRKKEGLKRSERQFKKKTGEYSWIEITVTPIYENGEVVYFLGTWVDIAERKEAEEEKEKLEKQLQQAQRMEAVGHLAGGVAHDYNNISSIVMGHAELALSKLLPDDPLYKDISQILSATRRSAEITRQLLAFARRQPIAPEVLDLNKTVDGMVTMIKRLIGEDIDFAWIPGQNIWPVKLDPSQVDQIIVNLCVNARDAIENVGKITIETGNVIFDEAYCADHLGFKPGEYVMLAVSDDGTGMLPEQKEKIFEPFYTTKGFGKGTGLGLSTIYGIVKQNNGFINVYSEPDKGTTFKLYLQKEAIGQPIEPYQDRVLDNLFGGGETILIVEDDIFILQLVEQILEKFKYTVLCASSPKDALRLVDQYSENIDLLLTDIILPGMNGRELANELRKRYEDLKVLYMSGYTANVIVHRGVLDEDINFIAKPFSADDLAAKVKKVLTTNHPKQKS